MEFYEIKNPTTQQPIDAIEANKYFLLRQLKPKVKSIGTYFKNQLNCEIFITFFNVTNSGGYPIVFGIDEDTNVTIERYYNDYSTLPKEEQEPIEELFWHYAMPLNKLF